MRGQEPTLMEFFFDLFFLASVVVVLAGVINFFISGIGPYEFTTWDLVSHFSHSFEMLMLQLSGVMDVLGILAVILAAVMFLFADRVAPRGTPVP